MSSAAALLCTWLRLHVVGCCFRRSVAVLGRYATAVSRTWVLPWCTHPCISPPAVWGAMIWLATGHAYRHYHVSGDMHMQLGAAANAGTQSCELGVELLLCSLVPS